MNESKHEKTTYRVIEQTICGNIETSREVSERKYNSLKRDEKIERIASGRYICYKFLDETFVEEDNTLFIIFKRSK